MMENDNQVLLVRVNTEYEASIIEGLLKDAGIPCWVKTHGTSEAFPMDTGEQSWADIYVSPEKQNEAQTLLDSLETLTEDELNAESDRMASEVSDDVKKQV